MHKWLVFGLLFGLMVFPSTVGAQGGTKLDALNIELWSEYDKPSMLVINQFVVSQDTSLPASVTLRFPKDGNLIAVAVENTVIKADLVLIVIATKRDAELVETEPVALLRVALGLFNLPDHSVVHLFLLFSACRMRRLKENKKARRRR